MSIEHKIRTLSYIKKQRVINTPITGVFCMIYSVKQFLALLRNKQIFHFLQKIRLSPVWHNLHFLLSARNSGH